MSALKHRDLNPVSLKHNDAELARHLKVCRAQKGKCIGCKLATQGDKYLHHLQLPWLGYVVEDGRIQVGCVICHRTGRNKGPFGLFEVTQVSRLKRAALLRHEKSECHVQAWRSAAEKTGLPGPEVEDHLDAPSYEVFKDALKRRLDGLACQAALPQHGIGPDKLRQLSFCLSEAKRMLTRAWLMESAATIALQQDERNQRLLLRFTAASSNMERRSGVLGLAKNFGSAAGSISQATERIIREFCTPGFFAPGLQTTEFPLCEALLESIRSKIEVVTCDNAGDEQKATELLRTRSGSDGKPFLPNMRLGLRDHAHASRRVIKRPFDSDPVLKDIMTSVFLGKDAIVPTIENSYLAKNRLEHHCSKIPSATKTIIRSMSLARQRFDSTQKPIGRFCLYLIPLLTTSIEMAREKKGEEAGMRAIAFLAFCTEETLLLISMIADAGDEGSMLCRSFDRELPASEELANEIATFITWITRLFDSAEPVCVLTGYTHHMITLLSEREILLPTLDGKGVRSLGGPGSITADLVTRCLQRMQTWVRLAKMVIKHEFPEWDLVSAFQLFNVAAGKNKATQTQENHIKRLAQFFKLDVVQFRAQFIDLSALARVHASNAGCDSFTAWQATIEKVLSTKKRRDQHPCDIMQVALSRWAAWSPSSSAVEQSFGHMTHFATERQWHASEASECNDAVLLLDHSEALEERQIALAREARLS